MGTRSSCVAWGAALAAVSLCSVSLGSAQPLEPDEIPPALRPWVPWVLADQTTYGCTPSESAVGLGAESDPICVWPSSLRVELASGGATFAMEVTADREYALTLPGSGRTWPLDVRVDGRAASLVSSSDAPIVLLAAGAHRVEGRFAWTSAPDTLAVPADVARVLVVQGGAPRTATRDTDGAVWLHAAHEDESPVEEADSVSLEVYRQLVDGSPLEIVTRVSIHVAGRPRELRLGAVLPDGAVPVSVSADLATRLTAEGELTLQLHAGTFSAEIHALVARPDAALAPPRPGDPWPAQEVWTWVPNEAFRQVELSGASSIDPARTTLPDDWRSHSAYLVEPTTTVTLTTVRRGEPTPPPNALALERRIWLDQDGAGASVSDRLDLELHSGFRIELSEGELGRVQIGGQDQLITRAVEGGPPGVEVRDTRGSVDAEWRIDAPLSSFAAVAWSEDAQSVSTTLSVPPGWLLLHAGGVDRAPGSWSDLWTLLGFFALLLITVVVGRVYGPAWGAAAFVGVGLAYHEADAPQWIWVSLAVTLALHRVLGARAIARWARWLYVVFLVAACVMVVVFAAGQARVALHPALDPAIESYAEETPEWLEEPPSYDDEEGGSGRRHRDDEGAMGQESAAPAASRYGIAGSASEPTTEARSYGWMDPSSVVQTGFGCPTWTWRTYSLQLDGPVGHDHRIRVWLSPPWLTSLLGLLRAGLALALCFVAIQKRPQTPGATAVPAAPAAAASAALLLGLAVLGSASAARAQATAPVGPIPSPEMLAELRARLSWTPECGDTCAEASRMRVSVHGDVLAIDIDVGVAAQAAYPIPGPADTWAPEAITLDGQPAHSLARLSSGFVHVRLTPGAHALHVEGSVAGHDAVTLALGRAPRTIEITTDGWESDGSGTGPRVPESIQLRRSVPSTPVDAVPEGAEATDAVHAALPSWLVVERRLEIGVRWTVTSTLRRLSPATAADVVRIPLLAGESVTDSSVVIDGQVAVVTIGAHDDRVTWSSTIEPAPEILLRAPESGRLSETWTLACTPLWHCTTSGIDPTQSASSAQWAPRFDPWPGESLTVALTRPAGVDGRSTTIDSASLHVSPGARMSSSTLSLHVRTSVSAPVALTIPEGADVRSLSVDGQDRPIQRVDGALAITLQPGAHDVALEWQEGEGWTSVLRTPHVTFGGSAVNLALDVDVTSDRWLLWIAGPPWGPAVLIWPYMIVIVIVALALSRRRELLPTLTDWVLLGLGLTQVPWVLALFVIGWFFAIEWRRATPLGPLGFDLRQLVVVGYTLFAAGALIGVITDGLLGTPGMDVEGPGSSSGMLHFFVDRADGALPEATIITVPVFVFRVLMFLWAGWLAIACVRWARRGWAVFAEGGLWRALAMPAPPQPGRAPVATSAPAASASATPSPTPTATGEGESEGGSEPPESAP